jgi:hypothetical protein
MVRVPESKWCFPHISNWDKCILTLEERHVILHTHRLEGEQRSHPKWRGVSLIISGGVSGNSGAWNVAL